MRSQQVFFPHHVPNTACSLLSSVLFFLPSWRLQLRVVYGILQSVLELVSPSARHRHPRHPSVNPCFMMSSLLMYRSRAFPIASASAIVAGELIKQHHSHASHTLGLSQGLADTGFRNVRSTRSVASRRLTLRTLSMPSSSLRSDTPRKIPFSNFGPTLTTRFVTPQNAAVLARTCAPCAARRLSCRLDLFCTCSLSQRSISQARAGLGPPGNSCPKRLTRQAKFVLTASFASFTALFANPLLCESFADHEHPVELCRRCPIVIVKDRGVLGWLCCFRGVFQLLQTWHCAYPLNTVLQSRVLCTRELARLPQQSRVHTDSRRLRPTQWSSDLLSECCKLVPCLLSTLGQFSLQVRVLPGHTVQRCRELLMHRSYGFFRHLEVPGTRCFSIDSDPPTSLDSNSCADSDLDAF